MPRKADEYAVYILLTGGHREEVRFPTVQHFQKCPNSELRTPNSKLSPPLSKQN